MSLKTLKFPDSVPIERAATAWGLEAEPLHKFSATDTLTSHELRKFLMKTTEINIHGKTKPAFKEFFVRFMVLSLKYPLIEDTEKAILKMLDRDYLRPEDEALFREKSLKFFKELVKAGKVQKYVSDYYENLKDEYVAQFPKRVLLETIKEVPFGSALFSSSKVSLQMGLNLHICAEKMSGTLSLIPIADQVSLEIIQSNPLLQAFKPIIGSLKMRRPIADQHTRWAIGG